MSRKTGFVPSSSLSVPRPTMRPASILAVMSIMGPFGQQGTVRVGACINVAVGLTVLSMHLRSKSAPKDKAKEKEEPETEHTAEAAE